MRSGRVEEGGLSVAPEVTTDSRGKIESDDKDEASGAKGYGESADGEGSDGEEEYDGDRANNAASGEHDTDTRTDGNADASAQSTLRRLIQVKGRVLPRRHSVAKRIGTSVRSRPFARHLNLPSKPDSADQTLQSRRQRGRRRDARRRARAATRLGTHQLQYYLRICLTFPGIVDEVMLCARRSCTSASDAGGAVDNRRVYQYEQDDPRGRLGESGMFGFFQAFTWLEMDRRTGQDESKRTGSTSPIYAS